MSNIYCHKLEKMSLIQIPQKHYFTEFLQNRNNSVGHNNIKKKKIMEILQKKICE